MSTARLSSKGQLVIPASVRKRLNLKPGDRIDLRVEGDRLILQGRSATHRDSQVGKVSASGSGGSQGHPSYDDRERQPASRGTSLSHLARRELHRGVPIGITRRARNGQRVAATRRLVATSPTTGRSPSSCHCGAYLLDGAGDGGGAVGARTKKCRGRRREVI